MDQIAARLDIRIGSTSQGLKTLRSIKAIRSAYIPGDRRDHYLAESEFRRLFSSSKTRFSPFRKRKGSDFQMEKVLGSEPTEEKDFYKIRIEKLKRSLKRVEGSFLH